MNQLTRCTIGIFLTGLVLATGCERTDSTASTPAHSDTGLTPAHDGREVLAPPPYNYTDTRPGTGAGGAPLFGKPTGTGFSTGDAARSGGQGTGLMGFHGTGEAGASGTSTDRRIAVVGESHGVHGVPPTTAPVVTPGH